MDRPSETVSYGPVCLRRWRADDADVAYRVVMESLEHLRPWMPWAADYDHDQAVRFTAQSEEDWASRDAYQYAITGRGLVTAAAAALVREAFALPEVDRVEIIHDLANTRSAGVPRRLGFTEVGRRASRQLPAAPGESGIEVVWRLTRHDTVGQ